ncbi:MAG: Crp/Fnr family transcriptional regulator, partial [Pseudomonadota bacterium]
TDLPLDAQRRSRHAAGQMVFRQGDPVVGVFAVVSGAVALRRSTADGQALSVHNAVSGELFAEASLFTPTYHCDARCNRDSDLIQISKAAMLDAIAHQPAFALAWSQHLAITVQRARQRIELLAVADARERVRAAVALGLLDSPVTEFAARIGLHQATCYRALSALVHAGVLVRHGRGRYATAPGQPPS